ncbi:MAG: diguanylate cyclase (GGDEF)-like protein [Flavobacteriales bacterium]|jgi:diguanylate cyclase (GGDEF)-like protein
MNGLLRRLLRQVAVFALYFTSGWIGIRFAGLGEGALTLIWLPSGVALAACIVWGRQVWPAIWFGSFAVNTPYLLDFNAAFPWSQAIITGGLAATVNTRVQALYAHNLYQRYVGTGGLTSTSKVLLFVFKVILFPCVINISLLTALYSATGYVNFDHSVFLLGLPKLWLIGVVADFHGYFVIVPIAMCYVAAKQQVLCGPSRQEQGWAIIGFIVIVSSCLLFTPSSVYLLMAVGVLVSLRQGIARAGIFVLAVSLVLTFITVQGVGPFNGGNPEESFVSLLTFVFGLGFPVYLIAADRSELGRAYQHLESKVVERTKNLNEVNKQLECLSLTDALTGVANRRAFDMALSREWSLGLRTSSSLTLMMIDIDKFKEYNDHYGHAQGDECLKTLAASLANVVRRPADILARYGGEEFSVLLPTTTNGLEFATKLQAAVEDLGIPHNSSSVLPVVTVSIGVCSFIPSTESSADELIKCADIALYEAKRSGRNRVVMSGN